VLLPGEPKRNELGHSLFQTRILRAKFGQYRLIKSATGFVMSNHCARRSLRATGFFVPEGERVRPPGDSLFQRLNDIRCRCTTCALLSQFAVIR